jgi:predicted AAA+ superfamily ATPase
MVRRLLTTQISNSFFLFGARGTGKTTWIREHFLSERTLYINLLRPEEEHQYAKTPGLLENEARCQSGNPPDWVIIDEVQKLPKLLDTVHHLIESKRIQFILTGSSARKLKRGGANLLAGRAYLYRLYPLTHAELGGSFNLDFTLNWGSMPQIFSIATEAERLKYLSAYTLLYLKEEIQMEQVVRNLDPFRSFLEVSAQMDTRPLNYDRIARDVGVDSKTVQNYFSILEETYLGTILPAFHQSVRKSQRQAPKFYWFDAGVKRTLSQEIRSPLVPSTAAYGHAFEAFVINEVVRWNAYHDAEFKLSYLESHHGGEIDLILTRGKSSIAIEIKSNNQVDETEVRALEALASDVPGVISINYVSLAPRTQRISKVDCIHWTELFTKLAEWNRGL